MNRIPDIRTGIGFDVHAFSPPVNPLNNTIMLAGVKVPHTHSIIAHSDGDVCIHAIVDAILGALANGDIGMHFPPSDPQWKDADSTQFLTYTMNLVRQAGATLLHVDTIFICERPKIGLYREAMKARLAELMEISADRISIKATTTEKLGFLGRKEGLAVQAIATLYFS